MNFLYCILIKFASTKALRGVREMTDKYGRAFTPVTWSWYSIEVFAEEVVTRP